MARTPNEVVEQIGREYVEELPVIPPGEHETTRDIATYEQTRTAFEVMAEHNREKFEEIPVTVIFQEEDPYDNYYEMVDEVNKSGVLRVFSGGDPHPIWEHEDELIGRAVHDWFGHLELETTFDVVGEYKNWRDNRQFYPAFCDRVYFTEVIGQLGAAYYLDDGFDSDEFEQKVFPAPVEWIEELSRAMNE